jgi:hypothetical protein
MIMAVASVRTCAQRSTISPGRSPVSRSRWAASRSARGLRCPLVAPMRVSFS